MRRRAALAAVLPRLSGDEVLGFAERLCQGASKGRDAAGRPLATAASCRPHPPCGPSVRSCRPELARGAHGGEGSMMAYAGADTMASPNRSTTCWTRRPVRTSWCKSTPRSSGICSSLVLTASTCKSFHTPHTRIGGRRQRGTAVRQRRARRVARGGHPHDALHSESPGRDGRTASP